MKAAVYDRSGPPEVFRYVDVPDPDVGPGAVLVRNEYVSIEGGDVLHRAGGEITRTPHIVGYQSAGIVEAVGTDVTAFAPGDRVVTLGMDGSHAELRAVPESFVWEIPDRLATDAAAVVPVPFGTAHDALFEFGRLVEGETVLVTAGSGGVGVAAIQMAKRAGARVLTTASSSAKLERLAELGADDGIDYRTADIVGEIRRLTGGSGVDLVVENVGGATFTAALQSLAYRGRCVSVGEVGRGDATVAPLAAMRERNLSVTGYFMGMEMLAGRRCHTMVAGILDDLAAGTLRAVIDRRFALADAAEAHAYIESHAAVGRVLLEV